MKKPRKKLSKKTKISGLVLLAFVSAVSGFYLLNRDNGDVLSWVDSNWLYRKSIDVNNSQGSTLINEEVLIEVDTASLISAGKLQNDCDDLRFYDSDDATSLTYWVEGECNTTYTQVWIQIPSLPSAGKTIYMYYGNASAANAEAAWTGNFINLNANASCDSGWTRNTSFDDKFAKGSDTLGTTGGSSAAHGHNDISLTFDNCSSTSQLGYNENWYWASPSHTHTATVSVNNNTETTLPPYYDMPYCQSSNLNISTNSVLIYTSLPSSGWTRFSALDNKYPRSSSSYATTGGAATHTHTSVATTTSTAPQTTYSNLAGSNTAFTHRTHSHALDSHTSTGGSNLPPYIDVIFAYPSSSGESTPGGAITLVSSIPPLGWTRYSSFDDKYLRGASSYGATGGSLTHNHSFTFTTGTSSSSTTSTAGSGSSACNPHTHTTTESTNTVTMEPPYYTVLYAQKHISETTTVSTTEEVENTAPNAPTLLQTEGETNPIEVSDLTPEFTATFTDSDTTDTANYYQIEVNTSSDFTGTVMWDSTKTAFGTPVTNNSTTPEMTYAGTTPAFSTTYYWRMKVWDNSDAESDWSSTNNFTMATESVYNSPLAPTGLQTDDQTNPTLLYDPYPHFSSVYQDLNTQDSSAYEIEINTSSDFTGTVMWDSDKQSITITSGNRSSNIQYEGTPLSNTRNTLYWRMRYWDLDDNMSEWSETATFVDYYPSLMFEGMSLEGISLN